MKITETSANQHKYLILKDTPQQSSAKLAVDFLKGQQNVFPGLMLHQIFLRMAEKQILEKRRINDSATLCYAM